MVHIIGQKHDCTQSHTCNQPVECQIIQVDTQNSIKMAIFENNMTDIG